MAAGWLAVGPECTGRHPSTADTSAAATTWTPGATPAGPSRRPIDCGYFPELACRAGMTDDLSKEILLALLSLHTVADVAEETWDAVARLAHVHAVDPLLYRQLRLLGMTDQVPLNVVEK